MRRPLSASIPDKMTGRSSWGAPLLIIALGLYLMSCSSKEPTAEGPEAREEVTEDSAEAASEIAPATAPETAPDKAPENAPGSAPEKTSGDALPNETPVSSEPDAPVPLPAAEASGEPASAASEPERTETAADGFERAKAVKTRHEDVLMRMPGVQGVGVGKTKDGRYAITIFLLGGGDGADRSAIPAELDGVPVEVLETGPIRARGGGGMAAKPD